MGFKTLSYEAYLSLGLRSPLKLALAQVVPHSEDNSPYIQNEEITEGNHVTSDVCFILSISEYCHTPSIYLKVLSRSFSDHHPRRHFRQVSAAIVSIRQEKIKYRQRIKA